MTTRKIFGAGMAWLLAVLTILPGTYAQVPRSANALADSKLATAGSGQQNAQSADVARELKAKLALAAAAANGGQSFEFNSWEFEYRFGDKPVKGAPFSAQIITEDTRTLANGVHISHKLTGALYRDSEGRTRREQPREGTTEIVMIEDPVATVSYRLNLMRRTAQKIPHEAIRRKAEAAGVARRQMEQDAQKTSLDEATRKQRAEEDARKAEMAGAPQPTVTITAQGYQNKVFTYTKSELPQKAESLGKQMIEGVEAEGTRATITIPTGSEGNDQPFDIVSESWYSADLQITVMSKHSDPRTGDNVYRLTNINRSEPPSSLFAPPPDFTVADVKMERRTRE